jgi:hypothetical protein
VEAAGNYLCASSIKADTNLYDEHTSDALRPSSRWTRWLVALAAAGQWQVIDSRAYFEEPRGLLPDFVFRDAPLDAGTEGLPVWLPGRDLD